MDAVRMGITHAAVRNDLRAPLIAWEPSQAERFKILTARAYSQADVDNRKETRGGSVYDPLCFPSAINNVT